MNYLRLAPGVDLPIDAVTQTFAILGKRGSGKTTTASVFTEELLGAGQQVVILDPLDVTWGLRGSRDGKGKGFPITVLGGDHADLPLEATAGGVIADFVVDQHASLILSLRHFSLADQRRFVTDFAERLYSLKGKQQNRSALHLVIDEVDEFAHQRIPAGHERLFGAIDRLVRRGRASGIGVTMISQRPAVIHKDILSQAEVLLCHQTVSPQDRKALDAWVEAHDAHDQRRTFMDTIATLARGEAWIWSPGWLDLFKRVKIRDRKTFDSSATPTQIAAVNPSLAPVDLEGLQERMAATIEKAKADDPRELKKRIADLERQVVDSKRAQWQTAPPPVEVPLVTDEDRALIKESTDAVLETVRLARVEMTNLAGRVENLHQVLEDYDVILGPLKRVADAIYSQDRGLTRPVQLKYPQGAAEVFGRQFEAAARTEKPRAKYSQAIPGDPSVGKAGLRRMLIALAQRNGLNRRQLGVRAGMSSRSGTFDTYLSKARTNGWIGGQKDRIEITPAGLKALGRYDPLPEGRDLLHHWLGELGESGAARMLRALADAYPRNLTRQALGEAANISDRSGTFDTYLSKLRTLELIEGRGELRASDELFA